MNELVDSVTTWVYIYRNQIQVVNPITVPTNLINTNQLAN